MGPNHAAARGYGVTDELGAKLLATLRRAEPVKVRVYDAQDDSRDIAVPTRRKRWSHVAQTIDARPWVRCELLDKSGGVLAYVINDGPAGELEELTDREASGNQSQQRWFLEMMIRAQTTALTFRDKEHSALLQSMRDMLELNMANTRELMGIMRLQRDESMALAEIRAAAEQNGDWDRVVKLIEASPKLLQTVGPILMALKPKPKATGGK
jgi:hypothetical protein